MDSARAELARRILVMLAKGDPVPFHDAFQLRNWAVSPEDAMSPRGDRSWPSWIKRKTGTQTRQKTDSIGLPKNWNCPPLIRQWATFQNCSPAVSRRLLRADSFFSMDWVSAELRTNLALW